MRVRKYGAAFAAIAMAFAVLTASGVTFAQLRIGGSNSNFGSGVLNGGFMPDPFTVAVTSGATAGNDVDASSAGLGSGCRGHLTQQPDYILQYNNARAFLRFYFVGQGDATLVINDASGRWHCNDDSWSSLNPTVDIQNPPSGQYDVWVGSYRAGQNIRGQLFVTELQGNHP